MVSDAAEPISEPQLELTYTGVFVHSREHIIVPAIIDSFAEDRRDHAVVQHWLAGDWVQHLVDESLCGVCAREDKATEVFNVGVGGHVVVARIPGGEVEEDVDLTPRGPSYSETLRCVKLIDGVVHVAGMARQVYRRDAPRHWSAIDVGVYQPRGARENALGFLDLDGFDQSEIYAVGYKGEIWSFDGARWTRCSSPTNVALTRVLASTKGDVFVAGLAGSLIHGRADKWAALANISISDDFWGMAEFNGAVYVASNRAVYRIEGEGLLPVDLGQDQHVTTSYLHAADGVLVSVGEKDILRTDDGVRWTAMPKP